MCNISGLLHVQVIAKGVAHWITIVTKDIYILQASWALVDQETLCSGTLFILQRHIRRWSKCLLQNITTVRSSLNVSLPLDTLNLLWFDATGKKLSQSFPSYVSFLELPIFDVLRSPIEMIREYSFRNLSPTDDPILILGMLCPALSRDCGENPEHGSVLSTSGFVDDSEDVEATAVTIQVHFAFTCAMSLYMIIVDHQNSLVLSRDLLCE